MIDLDFIAEAFPKILLAVPVTIGISLAAAVLGWILGMVIALVRKYRVPVLSQLSAVFVSFMRGVPLIILLYISYYALPILFYSYGKSIGITLDMTKVPAVVYAILALMLDQASYSSEIFRSALGAVDEGQMEAAYSVGMTRTQGLSRIVFPQAMAVAIPNLSGLFVGLIKGTALAYYVGVYEIMATASILAQPSYSYIEAYIMTTVTYEIISVVVNKLFRSGEKRLKLFRTGAAA